MRKLSEFLFSFFIFISIFPFVSNQVSATQEGKYYPKDEIIIRYKPSFSDRQRLSLHREIGTKHIEKINALEAEVLRIKNGNLERILQVLNRNPNIVYAEPNYEASVFELSSDPGVLDGRQWNLFKVGVAGENVSAWDYSNGDSKVQVAILDTGIDQDHEDLKTKIVGNKNCTDSLTFDDENGHGSHVAGIVAAATNNKIGVAGVGYDASLINAKVLKDNGIGYYSWIAECITWAADRGVKVINMSLGGVNRSRTLEDAINYAYQKGVVIVTAAGNSGKTMPSYPAYYKNTIAVSAVDRNDRKPKWSNWGKWVDVAAPGVSIYSTLPNHRSTIKLFNYGYLSGTSMAAPHVSGLAALLFSVSKDFTNEEVRNLIEQNSDEIFGTNLYWKFGRINAYKSLYSATLISPKDDIVPTSIVIPSPTVTPFPSPTPSPTKTITPSPTPTRTKYFYPFPTFPGRKSRFCKRFPLFCK